jgi:hypothetical protein
MASQHFPHNTVVVCQLNARNQCSAACVHRPCQQRLWLTARRHVRQVESLQNRVGYWDQAALWHFKRQLVDNRRHRQPLVLTNTHNLVNAHHGAAIQHVGVARHGVAHIVACNLMVQKTRPSRRLFLLLIHDAVDCNHRAHINHGSVLDRIYPVQRIEKHCTVLRSARALPKCGHWAGCIWHGNETAHCCIDVAWIRRSAV